MVFTAFVNMHVKVTLARAGLLEWAEEQMGGYGKSSYTQLFFFNCGKYTVHKIYHLDHLQVYNSMTLSTSSVLCKYHPSIHRILHFPKLKFCAN